MMQVRPEIPALALAVLLAMGAAPATAEPNPKSSTATVPRARLAYGVLLNPVESTISAFVNDVVIVSPAILIGDGRAACVIAPQLYALTRRKIAGAGASVGFRIFSGRRFDGLYFGVRFGGGVGNHSFKTFLGQMDAGWMWSVRAFRVGVGVNAGGGYVAHADERGALYLFSLDLSLGFALGHFG